MADTTHTDSTVTWAEVLALVAQLDRSGLQDAEVQSGGVRVRVSRSVLPPAGTPAADPGRGATPTPTPTTPPTTPPSSATPDEPTRPTGGGARGPEITAPMLGVVYHRPSPDEPPFVEVGDIVTADTTVAILEVMKLMNQVTAGAAGTIAEVCVAEGQMVEFGDVLFRLEETA